MTTTDPIRAALDGIRQRNDRARDIGNDGYVPSKQIISVLSDAAKDGVPMLAVLEAVQLLAVRWRARGQSMIDSAPTLPESIQESVHDAGMNWTYRADDITRALGGLTDERS